MYISGAILRRRAISKVYRGIVIYFKFEPIYDVFYKTGKRGRGSDPLRETLASFEAGLSSSLLRWSIPHDADFLEVWSLGAVTQALRLRLILGIIRSSYSITVYFVLVIRQSKV